MKLDDFIVSKIGDFASRISRREPWHRGVMDVDAVAAAVRVYLADSSRPDERNDVYRFRLNEAGDMIDGDAHFPEYCVVTRDIIGRQIGNCLGNVIYPRLGEYYRPTHLAP